MRVDAALQQSAAVELFGKIHPLSCRWSRDRWSRGRSVGRPVGMPVPLLTARGRPTGRERASCEVPVVVLERR